MLKRFFIIATSSILLTSSLMAQSSDTPSSANAQEATAPAIEPITNPYLKLYVMYYTVSTFELLADAIDEELSNDPAVLAQCNVLILENIPSEILSQMPLEYQNYFRSVLPLEKAAAAKIAQLAVDDMQGLQEVSQELIDQKEALVQNYSHAAPQFNNMEAVTAQIAEEIGLNQFQEDYTKTHEKELQSDPKAMSAMLRAMSKQVMSYVQGL